VRGGGGSAARKLRRARAIAIAMPARIGRVIRVISALDRVSRF
jgi:hypothetical protein